MMGRDARELMLSGQGDKALQLFKVIKHSYCSSHCRASSRCRVQRCFTSALARQWATCTGGMPHAAVIRTLAGACHSCKCIALFQCIRPNRHTDALL